MQSVIVIKDRNYILNITYQDMIKYHGRQFIAGVAMAYKLLELAFRELIPDEIPSREKVYVTSAVNGPGIIDGFEMVTRVRSRGALIVDSWASNGKDAPDAADGKGGKYYFEFKYDTEILVVSLKHGILPREFITLAYKTHDDTLTDSDELRLHFLKEEIANMLMSTKTEELFNYYHVAK